MGALSGLEEYLKSYGMEIAWGGLSVLLASGAGEGPLIINELSKCTRFGKSIGEKIITNAQ